MKKLLFLVIILATVLFEATILNFFRVFNTKPDLLLVLVVIAAIGFDFKWAIIFCAFAGLCKDAFSINTGGMHTILFAAWGLLIIKLSRKVVLENNFMRTLVLLAVFLINSLAVKLIFFYYGRHIPIGIFMRTAFIGCVYTLAISPLMFRYIRHEYFSSKKCLERE
ncbi:MAG: rod shape-determining protein MreD [Candidatus Omnitrophota bacterium]